jgi:hypothetical protein
VDDQGEKLGGIGEIGRMWVGRGCCGIISGWEGLIEGVFNKGVSCACKGARSGAFLDAFQGA